MREIDLYLTEPQERFVFSESPHPAMAAGYGSGKSQAAVVRLLIKALQYPGLKFAFVEPTFDLVRLIAWPRFEGILDDWGIGYRLNRSESILYIANGSQIIFRSADKPDRLVGFEVADVVIDEADVLAQDKAQDVWVKMLGRARQRKHDAAPNSVACVSTPEGFRWMYSTFEKNPRLGYELIRAPTYSNPYLPAGYVDQLRASYPSQLIEAYLEGRFVNLTLGAVYPGFSRTENHTDETIQPGEGLHIGLDFNVYNCTAVILAIRGGQPRVLGELTKMIDTPDVIRTIGQRFPGHPIAVYPDASGNSDKTVNASDTDISLLRQAGFTVRVPNRNPYIKDRVMALNALILNGDGARHLRINTRLAPTVTEALEQQVYDANGLPDKSQGKDHAVDALGYIVNTLWPIVRPRAAQVRLVGL